MYFVDSNADLYFASVNAVTYAIPRYVGPHYNGTRFYISWDVLCITLFRVMAINRSHVERIINSFHQNPESRIKSPGANDFNLGIWWVTPRILMIFSGITNNKANCHLLLHAMAENKSSVVLCINITSPVVRFWYHSRLTTVCHVTKIIYSNCFGIWQVVFIFYLRVDKLQLTRTADAYEIF